jgi:hypothetical protein
MNRSQSYFLNSAAVILFCIAAFNLFGAVGSGPALNWPDPLLQLDNRRVLVIWGGLELLVSGVLLAGKSKWVKLALLVWLMTNILVYRVSLWAVGKSNFGDCLGNYVEWFTISPRTMSVVTKGLLSFVLAGSYAFLFLNWLRERKRKARIFVKAAAPAVSAQSAS